MDELEQLFRILWWRKICSDQRGCQGLWIVMQPGNFDRVADLYLGSLRLSLTAATYRVEPLVQLFHQREVRG